MMVPNEYRLVTISGKFHFCVRRISIIFQAMLIKILPLSSLLCGCCIDDEINCRLLENGREKDGITCHLVMVEKKTTQLPPAVDVCTVEQGFATVFLITDELKCLHMAKIVD